MGKRANGEGTISARRKDGKVVGWKGSVVIGYDGDRMERRWVSGKTKADVQQKMAQLRTELHTGMLADSEGATVAQFIDRWLDAKERDGVKPNTLRSYRDTDRLYIRPHIGRMKLDKLRPLDVERVLNALRKEGKSAQVLAYTLRVLKMALRQAVRWQMLPRNVADAITPPKATRQEMQVWTPEQVAKFLDAAQGHRMHAAFYLGLMTGMRRGELLGLQWDDVDWERSRLTVRHNLVEIRTEAQGRVIPAHKSRKTGEQVQERRTISRVTAQLDTPKTAGSRRTIILSAGTLAVLQAHRERQQAEQERAQDAWAGSERGGFVFASEIGTHIDPRNLNRYHRELIAASGVPTIRFHDMRHTAASLMIRRGIPPKTVSERLGHADVGFTLRTYTHLYDEQREEAAFDLSDFFPRFNASTN
ncbi:tyrosine-type recombinase/integrase [Deinococcus radiotolerans]|uniref:Site-specific integrase n=1 Tax=Deinococcus radiotolerans TaxID=1309407 RepID=A0ABQ2FEP4_9DEIO|nr:site-specific integrase [Deinococcus radiotolerans]GGK90954.1 site-specific integrase [Deinococcus radiotolerans]